MNVKLHGSWQRLGPRAREGAIALTPAANEPLTGFISRWVAANQFRVKYVILAFENCKYCRRAQSALNAKNVPYICVALRRSLGEISAVNTGDPTAIESLEASISLYRSASPDDAIQRGPHRDHGVQKSHSAATHKHPSLKPFKYRALYDALVDCSCIDGYKYRPYIIGKGGFLIDGSVTLCKKIAKAQ